MKSILLLLSLWSFGAHAATHTGPLPLEEHQQGKVVYYVSDSNKLIQLRLPYSVKLNLLEFPSLPSATRYYLRIYGNFDGNMKSQDVMDILAHYPGYQISEHSYGSAVLACKVQLPNGKNLPCDTPEGTGSFFSVQMTLTQADGDSLKTSLSAGVNPSISVSANYDVPAILQSESVPVAYSSFAKKLGTGGTVDLRGLVKALVSQAIESNVSPSSALFDPWSTKLITGLLEDEVNPVSSPVNLSQLLSSPLSIKNPVVDSETLKNDTLGWTTVSKTPQLEVVSSVGMGE